jgi:hypothetical protein
MPESHESFDAELHLPGSDPAAPAVEALRAMAARPAPEPGAALAAFLADPAASGESPRPRRDPVTVVRIRARRAGRIAVAAGAALTLAALGGAALAATGGPSAEHTATVQQDEPSGTSTTSTDDETTSTETADTDTETAEPTESDTSEATHDAEAGAPTAHTANPTAAANHHDGKGADDTHADVNAGGVVDHRAEHSPTAHPTGSPSVHPTGAPTEGPAATHPTGH